MNHLFKKRTFDVLKRSLKCNPEKKNGGFYSVKKAAEDLNYRGHKFIHLIPSSDLKRITERPCPLISKYLGKGDSKGGRGIDLAIMTASKKLRKIQKLKEAETCKNCRVKEECHLRDKEPAKHLGSTLDLSLVLYAMAIESGESKEPETEEEVELYLAGFRVLDNFKWVLEAFEETQDQGMDELIGSGSEDFQNHLKLETLISKVGKGKRRGRKVKNKSKSGFIGSLREGVSNNEQFVKKFNS